MANKSNVENTPSEALSFFVDQLVAEKKFENLDVSVMDQIKSDLLDRVEDRINAATLEHMPPERLEEFNQILESEDMEKIQAFCQLSIPDFDNVIAKELMNFRNTYLNS